MTFTGIVSFVAALVVFVIIVGLYSQNWRTIIKVALVIVVIEGAIRKWLLPQASDMVYFLKDLVIFVAYCKYYLSSEQKYPFKLNVFNITLLTFLVWGCVQVFTPSLGSPIIGLFGLKGYLFYVPMMWMLPSLFRSQEELYIFLRNYLLIVIPVAILAIVQFYSPVHSLINTYAGGMEANAEVDGNARVTATFSYLTGYGIFLCICLSTLFPLIAVSQKGIWRWILLLELLLVVGTSFMTGARSVVLYEVLYTVGYFGLVLWTQPSRAFVQFRSFLLPLTFVLTLVPQFFGEAIRKFTTRAVGASGSADGNGTFFDRVFEFIYEPGAALKSKGLIDSYGIGSTHQAMPAVRKFFHIYGGQLPPPSEGDVTKVIYDVGLIGFILWYSLRIILIFALFKVFLNLKTPFLKNLALAAFLLHAININAQLASNNIYGIYYWFFSGFIFLLPELEYRQLYCQNEQVEIYYEQEQLQ
jgi:hypothetical protein